MKNMTSAVNVREMSMAAGMEDMVYKHVVVNGNKIVNNTDRDNVISFPGTDTDKSLYDYDIRNVVIKKFSGIFACGGCVLSCIYIIYQIYNWLMYV